MSTCTMPRAIRTWCIPVITRNSQSAAMATRERIVTMPPAFPRPNIKLPTRSPRMEPIGARAHRETGVITAMVHTGTNTVESMSGMIFFMNFSTTISTGIDSSMGSTVAE